MSASFEEIMNKALQMPRLYNVFLRICSEVTRLTTKKNTLRDLSILMHVNKSFCLLKELPNMEWKAKGVYHYQLEQHLVECQVSPRTHYEKEIPIIN